MAILLHVVVHEVSGILLVACSKTCYFLCQICPSAGKLDVDAILGMTKGKRAIPALSLYSLLVARSRELTIFLAKVSTSSGQ